MSPKRDRLDQDIANGGRFNRSGDDLTIGSMSGEFIEQAVPASSTDNMQPADRAPGKVLNFFQGHAVEKRQAFQNTANKLSRCLRGELAGFHGNRPTICSGILPGFRNRRLSDQ